MPRNTNRRFNLIPTKAGISRARTGKSTHAALPWQDEPWLLPHGAAQGKTCAPPTPNPPKVCICQENPKRPGKAVLVSPERHSRHKWHLHPPGTLGHQLPGGHGTRNLLLSSLDSNSGPVPSAKPQCNPPGNSALTRTGSSVANSMRSFPSSCLTGASSSCTCCVHRAPCPHHAGNIRSAPSGAVEKVTGRRNQTWSSCPVPRAGNWGQAESESKETALVNRERNPQ